MAAHALLPATREVLRHPWVQRLARIHQLGPTSVLFPQAAYNRLAHSVGVARLAHRAAMAAATNSGGSLTLSQRKCIELAGLLHDVGHGPWSHTFDRALALLPEANRPRQWLLHHEARGQRLVNLVLGQMPHLVTPEECATISTWIHPPAADFAQHWLSEVVCNRRHGIDVDRMEYLVRDSALFADLPLSDAHPSLPLCTEEVHALVDRSIVRNNQWMFDTVDEATVDNILYLRSHLHAHMYQHPSVMAYEWALVDAIHADAKRRPDVYACLALETDAQCQQFVDLTEASVLDSELHAYQYGLLHDVPRGVRTWRQCPAEWQLDATKHAAARVKPKVLFWDPDGACVYRTSATCEPVNGSILHSDTVYWIKETDVL